MQNVQKLFIRFIKQMTFFFKVLLLRNKVDFFKNRIFLKQGAPSSFSSQSHAQYIKNYYYIESAVFVYSIY